MASPKLLPPSPELTLRVRKVLTNLFGMAMEKIDGPPGLMLRSQKRKVAAMIADLEDVTAAEMANALTTVADFVRTDPNAPKLRALTGGKS